MKNLHIFIMQKECLLAVIFLQIFEVDVSVTFLPHWIFSLLCQRQHNLEFKYIFPVCGQVHVLSMKCTSCLSLNTV